MKKFFEIAAWTIAITSALVIVFVKAPAASGVSGGKQASDIIDTAGSSLAKVIKSLQGN